jgi:hypothetical protein
MGLVTYPFLFSTSFLLVSAERLTHSSMLRTGTFVISLVKILSAAVSLGVFGLSAFGFLDFGVAFGLGLLADCGGVRCTTARSLRVCRSYSSLSKEDLGVRGEPETTPWLCCFLSVLAMLAAYRAFLLAVRCTDCLGDGTWWVVRIHPG